MNQSVECPTGLAHGMGTAFVPPDWPVLTRDEVGDLLRLYPDTGPLEGFLFCSPRPFSSAALVATGRGTLFVKRHHRVVRDEEGVFEEHRFIAYLRHAGLSVPDVLPNVRGSTTTATGDWVYEVHRPAEGVDLYRDAMSWSPFVAPSHGLSAGQALARLHRAAEGFLWPRRAVRPLVSSFTIFAAADPRPCLDRYVARRPNLRRFLADRPGWRDEILDALMPFHAVLLPFLDGFRPLWTHNDWHASNLTWSTHGADAEVRVILDFGLADRTCALHDLATAIERNAMEWLMLPADSIVHFDLVDALLDGYDSVTPLSPWHYRAMAALLPLVHAEFALSEVDYFEGVTGSRENALVAYDTFLLGHAQWFNSPEGRRLLNHVRSRALPLAANEEAS
ncbi:phosphotransferase [Telmatospirillum sp.]|uniref:phosphotransferase enzyme family protein n=1 Tax=Telmatospirillum sp. TaxID=2079197 RepID=UPI002842C431|nr:phosphotransferase [Telmatospirillum sp.]MDR3435588.1 phosphotransferase [Telmatospirillum sp.]